MPPYKYIYCWHILTQIIVLGVYSSYQWQREAITLNDKNVQTENPFTYACLINVVKEKQVAKRPCYHTAIAACTNQKTLYYLWDVCLYFFLSLSVFITSYLSFLVSQVLLDHILDKETTRQMASFSFAPCRSHLFYLVTVMESFHV